ncbi:hypothetical protein [Calothrix rhizosoleniae]|uniref:hypothetical protein n=1 Tax=Calothrix rhizosoleniae TaxID=888997 RepID=UPI000B4983FE|nr:hypothetical protein [Calothrix rhizosoleniae]
MTEKEKDTSPQIYDTVGESVEGYDQSCLHTKYFSALKRTSFISPQFIAGRERMAKRGFHGDVLDPSLN